MKDPEFVERMKTAVGHINDARDLLAKGPLDYYLRKLVEHSEALLTEFCPFKVGARAVIVADVPCSGGWAGCEKHLCTGNIGEVVDVDYYDGAFRISFVPDRQWWRNSDGKYHEVSNPYRYCLNAKYLQPIEGEKEDE